MYKRTKNLLPLLLLVVILCACQTAPSAPTVVPTATSTEAPELSSTPLVVYERAVMSTEAYERWAIYEDGTVLGDDTIRTFMSPEVIAELMTRIEESGFFEMDDIYMPEDPAPDQPLHALTVWADGQIKTVVAMEGVPMRPESLETLIQYVDALVHGGNGVAFAETR